MVTELQVTTEQIELDGGRVLRVSRVENPRGGETVVLEKLTGAYAARSLIEPSNGSRLVVSAGDLPELRRLLKEVTG